MKLRIGILRTGVKSDFISSQVVERVIQSSFTKEIEWVPITLNPIILTSLAHSSKRIDTLSKLGGILSTYIQQKKLDYLYIEEYRLIPIVFLARYFRQDTYSIFFTAHSVLVNDWLYYWLLIAPLVKANDYIWITSKYTSQLLKKIHPVYQSFLPVPLMVDQELTKALENHSLIHKEKRVLYLGRMVPEKGIESLIEAIGFLAKENQDIRLDLAGPYKSDEPFYQSLQKKICELNLQEQVHFLGLVLGEEKVNILARSTLLVYPGTAIAETFGVTIIEAFTAGIPVIASQWSAFPELIQDGYNGYTLSIAKDTSQVNPEELARRIEVLFKDQELLHSMQTNALESSKLYRSKVVCEQIIRNLRNSLLQPDRLENNYAQSLESSLLSQLGYALNFSQLEMDQLTYISLVEIYMKQFMDSIIKTEWITELRKRLSIF